MLTPYAQLCWVFFYIGLFGFGGGYAMISLIQFEVVNQFGWMNTSEFANLLALSQMTRAPSPSTRPPMWAILCCCPMAMCLPLRVRW